MTNRKFLDQVRARERQKPNRKDIALIELSSFWRSSGSRYSGLDYEF
jgi:hypothetical protein